VEAAQQVIAFTLALGVATLSVLYFRSQLQALRRLRDTPDIPPDDARRERRQIWRRLVSSGLLLLIALMLAGAQLWLESAAQRLADARDRAPSGTPLTDEQRRFGYLYTGVWISVLLLLLGVVLLAAFDLWSIRRYGKLQRRKLTDDRRAMIARQLRRLREERNGD
jgi:hypothetical protein